jgi:putative sigma-54 modulation protein
MKTNVKATQMELTTAISEYLAKRLTALDKFVDPADDSAMCYVEVGKISKHHKSGDVFRAEINLHIGGKSFRAEAEEADLYAAIDVVKDEMVAELRNSKTKRLNLLRRGGQKIKGMFKGMTGSDTGETE